MSFKNKNFLQLSHTKEWVPRPEAIKDSRSVDFEFASNPLCVEDLTLLSISLRSDDREAAIRQEIPKNTLDRLTSRNYFLAQSIGSYVSRLTVKSLLAANMVVPDIDEGTISGYLSEPFINHQILADLHSDHFRTTEERRLKASN